MPGAVTCPSARRTASVRRAGLLFCVFVAALLPRLAHLGHAPFWYDEIVTLQRASLPLPGLIRDSLTHHHLPTYFLLVAPFTGGAHPQIWLRLPSAIFGGLAVALVARIAAKAGGPGAGLGAALVFGLAPTQIAYSQEARSYTLVLCLILVALEGLLDLVRAGDAAGRGRATLGAWARLTSASAAALWVLGDCLPWLLIVNLVGAVLVLRASDRRRMLRNLLVADLAVLALTLPPYGAMLLEQKQSVFNGLSWVPRPSLALIWYDIGSVYLLRVSDFSSFHFMAPLRPVSALLAGLLMLSIAMAIWRLRGERALLLTLLLSWLVLPLLFGIISIWHPLLMPRYLLWSAAPFAILAGIGLAAALSRLHPAGRVAAFAAGTALLIANLLPFYTAQTRPRWDLAAQVLAGQARPGDVFYLYESGAGPTMRYYLPKNLQATLITDWSGDLRHAVRAKAQGNRVWAVYGDAWQTTSWESGAAFAASLAPLGTPAARQSVAGRITFWRFDPR